MTRPAIGRKPVSAERSRDAYRWDGNPPRPPRKGERYLSGAEPVAYLAPNDLTTPYFIAVKVTP